MTGNVLYMDISGGFLYVKYTYLVIVIIAVGNFACLQIDEEFYNKNKNVEPQMSQYHFIRCAQQFGLEWTLGIISFNPPATDRDTFH